MNKRKIGLSKKMLYADYIIAIILIVMVFIFAIINGVYTMTITNELIEIGVDTSTVSPPFNLDIFGVVLGIWIAQLGLSTGAYYVLVKSERKIELPIKLLNDLPADIKEQVDITQIITTVLSCTDN